MATFIFLQLFVPDHNVFAQPIFDEHTTCSHVVNSMVGKQIKKTERYEIFIWKYIKLTVRIKHSISHRTTLNPNPYLVEEATCFPFFEP